MNNLSIAKCVMLYDQFLKLENLESQHLDKVIEFVSLHADLVFRTKIFLSIEKQTLIKLIENDSLFIKEKDLYYAVLDWIDADLQRNNKQLSLDNKMNLFNHFKHLIRFTLMSKEQFDAGPAKSKLLSKEEVKDIEIFYKSNFANKEKKIIDYEYSNRKKSNNESELSEFLSYQRPRNEIQIYKLKYDDNKNSYIICERFSGDEGDVKKSLPIEEIMLYDHKERDKFMKMRYGKAYFKDGKRKKKVSTKSFASKSNEIKYIHLFKLIAFVKKDEYLEPELYENNTTPVEIKFEKFKVEDCLCFVFNPELTLSTEKEYRLLLRNAYNKIKSNTFKILRVLKTDKKSKLDVKIKLMDEPSLIKITDIYFMYRENYVHIEPVIKLKSRKRKAKIKAGDKSNKKIETEEIENSEESDNDTLYSYDSFDSYDSEESEYLVETKSSKRTKKNY